MAAFRAEWFKLRKRPAIWILLLAFFLVVLLVGYLLLYAIVTQTPEDATPGLDRMFVLISISPENMPAQVLSLVSGIGAPLGLIVGALAMGSEFSWQTLKTVATQGPRRVALVGGRAAALLVVGVLLALVAFAGGAAGTAIVTALEGLERVPPIAVDVATAFGVAVLIIMVWCTIGACLATLFRGAAWAIGIGLLYALALETVIALLPLRGRAGELLNAALIGTNANALVAWLSPEAVRELSGVAADIDPLQAAIVLLAYLAVAQVVAAIVFVVRDIA
jgi:ABC-type transport system involved in multi-copper enzyme maturation permease subunit